MSEPLRILILAANPVDTTEMALKAEHRLLRNKMRANAEAGNCEMLFEWAARFKDLKDALARLKPHVIHFAGHGSREGICLEDDEGRSSPVTKAHLADLFKSSGEHVRLVVLNACFSAVQAEAMSESVDFVVGTKVAVADDLAVVFAAHFYEALAVGSTVRDAYQKTQSKLASLDPMVLAEQYELLVRGGTDENQPLLPPMLRGTRESSVELKVKRARLRNAEFINEEGPRERVSIDGRGPNERTLSRYEFDDLEVDQQARFINRKNQG